MSPTIIGFLKRASYGLWELFLIALFGIQLHARDLVFTLAALLLPRRSVGRVISKGRPGYAGLWPEYQAPAATDSRSPCPGLNALANHGILPRNGRHITYATFVDTITHAYNLSPTLAEQLTSLGYLMDQGRGWLDLHDLNTLNVIQHDASFTRPDIAFCPDQSYPHPQLVERFLAHASEVGKDGRSKLTTDDFSYYSGLRRAECSATNGEYSLTRSFLHKYFGSGNSALTYSIFGGDVGDLRVWLSEERFPEGWEPKVRSSYGHPITFAAKSTFDVEFNIYDKQPLRAGDSLLNDQYSTMTCPPWKK